jgi:hypothetical protein
VRGITVRSAVRVAFGLSICFWLIVLVGLVALYILGLVSGGLGGVEGFIASLGFAGFRFAIIPFVLVFLVVSILVSAVMGLLAGVSALLYNHLHPIIGGLEVHVRDR